MNGTILLKYQYEELSDWCDICVFKWCLSQSKQQHILTPLTEMQKTHIQTVLSTYLLYGYAVFFVNDIKYIRLYYFARFKTVRYLSIQLTHLSDVIGLCNERGNQEALVDLYNHLNSVTSNLI